MTLPEPTRQYFSIGDVCGLTELKPHVLRYWESQFRFLNPAKNRSGNRVYRAREVELIMLVKHLLYTERFTIDGARHRLEHYRKTGELKTVARAAMRYETVVDIKRSLDQLMLVLTRPAGRSASGKAKSTEVGVGHGAPAKADGVAGAAASSAREHGTSDRAARGPKPRIDPEEASPRDQRASPQPVLPEPTPTGSRANRDSAIDGDQLTLA